MVTKKAFPTKAFMKKFFKVVSLGEFVCLQEHVLHGLPIELKVSVDAFLQKWQPYRGDLQQNMPAAWVDNVFGKSPDAEFDVAKAKAYVALKSYEENVAWPTWNGKLQLCVKPTEIYTTTSFKKGALILAPSVLL